jgi:hypothetical protein
VRCISRHHITRRRYVYSDPSYASKEISCAKLSCSMPFPVKISPTRRSSHVLLSLSPCPTTLTARARLPPSVLLNLIDFCLSCSCVNFSPHQSLSCTMMPLMTLHLLISGSSSSSSSSSCTIGREARSLATCLSPLSRESVHAFHPAL